MTKESVKKFIKEHKTEIVCGVIGVVGSAALAVVGVKWSKKLQSENFLVCDDDFREFINTVDEATDGCKQYVKLTLSELTDMIEQNGIVNDCVKDSDGNVLAIKSLIAFGNQVEP